MSNLVCRACVGRGQGCGWDLRGGLDNIDDGVKTIRVEDGNFTEHLSIQLNVSLLAAADEFAVSHPALPACGIQTDDPKSAEIAFSSSSVFLSVDSGPYSGLLG